MKLVIETIIEFTVILISVFLMLTPVFFVIDMMVK